MANVKISQLPLATSPLDSAVEMPVVQGGVTKRAGMTTIGFLQSGTSAVLRTAQNKMRDTVSVKDFGAVGDGVANDTTAIQAAINAVIAAGGGVVYFPSGDYRITSQLAWNGNDVWLRGDGSGASRIVIAFTTGDVIAVGDGTANPNNTKITDLSFNAPVARATGATIAVRNAYNTTLKALRFEANMYDNIVIDGGAQQYITHIDEVLIASGRFGITISRDGTFAQETFITNSNIANCTDSGLFLRNCGGLYCSYLSILTCARGLFAYPGSGQTVIWVFMQGVVADTCTEEGWRIWTDGGISAGWQLVNCWGASNGLLNTGSGMSIIQGSGRCEDITIANGRFIYNGGSGVVLGGCLDVHLVNVSAQNNSRTTTNSKHGVEIGAGVSQWSVIGGFFGLGGRFTTTQQAYGIFVNTGASNEYQIIGTNCVGNLTGGILDAGSGTEKYIYGNTGYRTSNQGLATITSGNSSVNVNHGLSVTPDKQDVQVTPVSDPSTRFWVSNTTSTQITITTSGAVPSDAFFGWSARVKGA